MSNQRATEETLSRMTELARRALQAQASAARQSVELGRAVLSPDADTAAAGRAWVEAVSREGARYWREAGSLGLETAGQLVMLGSSGMARVVAETQRALAPTARGARQQGGHAPHGTADHAAGPGAAAFAPTDHHEDGPVGGSDTAGADGAAEAAVDDEAARVAVVLRAVPGAVASGTVVVTNRHNRARRVELTAHDLRPATPGLVLVVSPDRVTIPAGEEHRIALEARLPAEGLRPGDRFTGTVDVSGGASAVVDVVVEVV